ncbi:MAG: hypothetical protein HPY44_15865 [Armatimonadetes bacterium]|nr:hypothetical protein [Armatimonadota bacterium]
MPNDPALRIEDRSGTFRLPAGGSRVVVIVDSAAEAIGLHELAMGVVTELGARHCAAVYDLGTQKGASPDAWLGGARAVRGAKTDDPLRVLGPTLDAISRDARLHGCEPVVVAAGPIWDLADYAAYDRPVRIITLPGIGVLPPGCPDAFTIDCSGEPEKAARSLLHVPIEIMIGQPGFMPYQWDNPEYALEMGRDGAVLVWRCGAEPADITVDYLSDRADDPLTAHIIHSDGSVKTVALSSEPLQPPPLDGQSTVLGHLSEREFSALREARSGRPFICPRCGHEHPAGCLRCQRDMRTGSAEGSPVFECISRASGLVLFVEHREQSVRVFEAASRMTRVERRCVVDAGPPAVCYRYDETARRWTREPFIQYHHVPPVTFLAMSEGG